MSDLTFIVYKNIHELIRYRGYVPQAQEHASALELERAFKKHDPIVISGTGPARNIKVLLVQTKDVLMKQKLPGIVAANADKDDDVIIVNNRPIQVFINNAMKEAEKLRTGRKMWYMTYDHLRTIIPEYCLVGTLRILSTTEKQEITTLNRIPTSAWSYMGEYDPMSLWLGAIAEDVIEVRGASETSGENLTYRYVVPQARYASK